MNLFESQASYHYADVEHGLLEEECREQLQAFFKRRRKEIKEKRKLERLQEEQRLEAEKVSNKKKPTNKR